MLRFHNVTPTIYQGPPSGALTVTTPVPYQGIRRAGATGAISIAGTYTGTITGAIEASFNSGSYQTVDAAPSAGAFAGAITVPYGQGTLRLRDAGNHATVASVAVVTVGDGITTPGDSNHSGRGVNDNYNATPTSAIRAVMFGNDGIWRPIQEAVVAAGSYDDPASATYSVATDVVCNGTYFSKLAKLIIDNTGVPVFFIPAAKGSTKIVDWLPGADHRNPATLYGANLLRWEAAGGGMAALMLIGTNDANAGGADVTNYEANLTTFVNAWFADTGKKVILPRINLAGVDATNGATVRAAQASVIAALPTKCVSGGDYNGKWTTVHYTTGAEADAVAAESWAAINTAFYGV